MIQRIKQICGAALLVCIGCSSTPTSDNTELNNGENADMQPVSMEMSMPGDSSARPGSGPVIINSVTPAPGSQQVPPVQPKTAEGMNPPHGQPGHRCDIAVGAPLNSPPGAQPTGQPAITTGNGAAVPPPVVNSSSGTIETKPFTPSGLALPPGVATTPAATTPPPASAPVKTAPGMNPPHGEPGHDCTIAVGAPLKK